MKKNKIIYELTPSQDVVRMQLLFSLDKRVINILMSAQSEKELDFTVMQKAIDIVCERHDCLRLRFIKKGFKLYQYFSDKSLVGEIPTLEFKTKEEQEKFILKHCKKPIKYLKGKVLEPYFIKTYDNKYMIFVKVCHLILDTYGLNVVFKDIFDIYNCLINNTEFPKAPVQFEEIVKKELKTKHDANFNKKREEFFTDYYTKREEPYYAGFAGQKTELGRKNFEKRTMKMFLVNNQTHAFMHKIDKNLGDRIIQFCEQNKISPANFLFYACTVTQSKLNKNIDKMLQLELCNLRATMMEKNCSGTKVQSLGCYVELNNESSAIEDLKHFCANQNMFYRYLGFSDMQFQNLTHKIWKSSAIRTYYAMSFSFTPFVKPEGVEFQMYSNGKFALPIYFAILFDVKTHEMQCVYDCQKKLTSEKQVEEFQKDFVGVIEQILDNENIIVKDIKLVEDENGKI